MEKKSLQTIIYTSDTGKRKTAYRSFYEKKSGSICRSSDGLHFITGSAVKKRKVY